MSLKRKVAPPSSSKKIKNKNLMIVCAICTEGHLPTNPMAVYGSCEGLTYGLGVNP